MSFPRVLFASVLDFCYRIGCVFSAHNLFKSRGLFRASRSWSFQNMVLIALRGSKHTYGPHPCESPSGEGL